METRQIRGITLAMPAGHRRSSCHLFTTDRVTSGRGSDCALIDRCPRTHVGLFGERATITRIFISSIPRHFASARGVLRRRIYEDLVFSFLPFPCFSIVSLDRSNPTRRIQQNCKVSGRDVRVPRGGCR